MYVRHISATNQIWRPRLGNTGVEAWLSRAKRWRQRRQANPKRLRQTKEAMSLTETGGTYHIHPYIRPICKGDLGEYLGEYYEILWNMPTKYGHMSYQSRVLKISLILSELIRD